MTYNYLLDLAIPEPNTGCWLWERSISGAGYGEWWHKGKRKLAHRVSYELSVGPIPKGLQIDHKCRVRCCINPGHLRCVTIGENVLCGEGLAAQNAKKTHCKHGHEFTPENTFVTFMPRYGKTRKTHRRCRECARLDCAKRRQARRECEI